MIDFKRSKKNRYKNALFNPYKNGISSYDMAYLSSKRSLINKNTYQKIDSQKIDSQKIDSQKDYIAA